LCDPSIFFFHSDRKSKSAGYLLPKSALPLLNSQFPACTIPKADEKLNYMKRMYLAILGILAVIGIVFALRYRSEIPFLSKWLPTHSTDTILDSATGKDVEWRPVDETSQGFKLEMPGAPRQVVALADNESGSTEPISMLQVKPEPNRTFAVAWADKPPVARMNDLVPEKTLDDARDGALARTATTKISEIRSNPQGFPGRDIEARNVTGGILDARLIYAGSRLYMLIATSPSAAGRHEEDVTRFFNSFTIASNKQIPETLPPAITQ